MSVHAAYRVSACARTSGPPARRPGLWLLALLAVAAFGFQAASASAIVVHLRSGSTVSFQPLRGAAASRASSRGFDLISPNNLDYNGGPIMPSNTNYTLYWAPLGSPAYPPTYRSGVNQYLEDLAHDSGGQANVDSVATQYNDAAGEFANYESLFGGELVDEQAYPASGCPNATICLTDGQIQTEIERYVAEHKLPVGLTHEYFVLTPPGVETCIEPNVCSAGVKVGAAYCAYHSYIGESQIVYSDDPYVTGNVLCDDGHHPNGVSDGALEGGLSHEHSESITDPQPNNAWTDFFSGEETGYENGDKCRTEVAASEFGAQLGTAPNGSPYNQLINGHKYWYQQEWSNQGRGCLQRLSFKGERPAAKFRATSISATQIHFDAGASTATGGVHAYSWQFNEGFEGTPSSPVETTSPTLNHTFIAGGAHNVALTVFASDGSSVGAAKTIDVGGKGPTASFFVTTASPTSGQAVSFDGSAATAGTGSITSVEWRFGDGSTGTGVSPTHTYGAAGSYEVVQLVTDGSGFTTSVAHIVNVASPPSSQAAGPPAAAPPAAPAITVPVIVPVVPAPVAVTARLVRMKLNRDGTADIFVRVSGSGVLSYAEAPAAKGKTRPTQLRALSVLALAGGVVKLHVRLSKAGARLLARNHRVTVVVLVKFRSTAGLSARRLRLTLTIKAPRRH